LKNEIIIKKTKIQGKNMPTKQKSSTKKNDLTTKKKTSKLVLAGGLGVSSAVFYSLAPLFIFFFDDNPLVILYPIFIATIQELMSFIVVSVRNGFEK